MIILGIDPGYATLGYGAVRHDGTRFTPLEYGVVTTPADLAFERRLARIYDGVAALIDRYTPDAISVEELFFTNNRTTGIGVAQARGVVLLCGAQRNVPIYEYTPPQVKQAVVGYGRAEKKQVMEMTRMLLNLETCPKPDDAADALAVAICHAHSAGSLLGHAVMRERAGI